MKTTENTLQKIQEILEALVINERYYLITCIKKYNENSLTDKEIFNLSIQSKKNLRENLKKISEKIIENELITQNN
jgi:hypothetical protein